LDEYPQRHEHSWDGYVRLTKVLILFSFYYGGGGGGQGEGGIWGENGAHLSKI
jgi:hypothetical protein